MKIKYKCNRDGTCKARQRGDLVNIFYTGDEECDAISYEFKCGGIYHKNYMDRLSDEKQDHLCFWNCKGCKLIDE